MKSVLILCMISLFLLEMKDKFILFGQRNVKYRNVFFKLNIVSTHFTLLLSKYLDHF